MFSSESEISEANKVSKILLLRRQLYQEKIEDFFETIKSIYASTPYTLSSKADEGYFHSLFYLMMCASGIEAYNEVLTSNGRIDLLVEFADKVYIIEFKCNQSADMGIKQIRERKYYERYLKEDSPHGITTARQVKCIYLIGINFSTDEKNIMEWKLEKM